jgi:hypothetical protein
LVAVDVTLPHLEHLGDAMGHVGEHLVDIETRGDRRGDLGGHAEAHRA